MPKTVADVLQMAANVKMVDLRFTDLPGVWQHFTIPAHVLEADTFENGIPFDGSSIRGFKEIHESDMLLMLDPSTAFIDPIFEIPTLVLIGDVFDPITREPYSRDPRFIASRAETYLKQTGIGDKAFMGPEPEFFIFGDVRYGSSTNEAFYHIDSREGWWNSGKELGPNFGGQIAPKRGYFPTPPTDTLQDVRSKIVMAIEGAGIPVEIHHHEVATAGQGEIGMRFNTLTRQADNVQIYKYMVKNVARQNGLTATFMPKPLFGDNGSGMHVHQSIWKGDKNMFYDEAGYAQLSDTAKYYIGGLLKHAPALLALVAPEHQLVSPPGARLRSAGEPGLLAAQPLGGLPHPGGIPQPEVQARRIPCARSVVQPVSVLRRAADGRAGRYPESHRSRRAGRQGPLRPAARGSQEDQAGAGVARSRAVCPGG